jgi:hypothetical protein
MGTAYVVITVGGLSLALRLGLMDVVVMFWVTFAASLRVVVIGGHVMTARWHLGPLSGSHLWWTLVTSPEILVFLFFMITDPKSAPHGRIARMVYGAMVGFVAALLLAPARSEFMSKVAVLGALTFTCAMRPLLERLFPDGRPHALSSLLQDRRRTIFGAGALAVLVGMLLIATLPARGATALVGHSGPMAAPAHDVDTSKISIVIDPEVRTVDARISEDLARRMVVDLLNDLTTEAEALRLHDTDLAATALRGARLERVQQAIQAPSQATVPTTFRFDSVVVVILRNGRQATPVMGLHARGVEIHGLDPTAGPSSPNDVPYDHNFVLVPTPTRYLIDDYPS